MKQKYPHWLKMISASLIVLVTSSACSVLSGPSAVLVINDDTGGPSVTIEREANDGQALTRVGAIDGKDTPLNENVVVKVRGLKEGTVIFSTERFLDELVDGEDLVEKSKARFGLGVPSSDISQYELEVSWGNDTFASPAQVEIKTDAIKVQEVTPCVEDQPKKGKKGKKNSCTTTREVAIAGSIKNLRSWPVSNIELSVRSAKNKLTWLDHPSFSQPSKDGAPQPLGEGVILQGKSTLPFEFSLQVPQDWDPQDQVVVRVVKAVRAIKTS
jgi:hypothetical protein